MLQLMQRKGFHDTRTLKPGNKYNDKESSGRMLVYPLEHELDKPFILRINKIQKPFPAHRHHFLEFSYVISGSGKEIINGKEHKLKRGTFTLLLPYQVHEIWPDNAEGITLYNCNIGIEAFYGPNKLSNGLNEMIFYNDENLPAHVDFSGKDAEKIEGILQDLIQEDREKQPWKDLLFKSKVIELMILFSRKRISLYQNKHIKNEKNNRNYLWKILFYIHNHYMEEISLEKLANKFGISSTYLSTSFKNFFGENIHSFINDIRIKHACGLLAATDKKITDIASEVGFNSYTTFSRVFRQKTGISASEYRNR
jgi:AraC-like DNA-binding protein/mannose-6-phosphate isomerase-like protein (cupin superfamily)